MTKQRYSRQILTVLAIQIAYIGMSVMWNLIGLGLKSIGQQPLGNSASMTIVVIMLVLALIIVLSATSARWLYALATGILGLGSLSAIYTAITGAAELWPSPSFRVFGASINVLGLVGFALACKLVIFAPKKP